MALAALAHINPKQRERLAHIEFRLWFLGDATRRDLMDRFGVAPAVATRDFAAYRELAPRNMAFEGSGKRYVLGSAFSPCFEHTAERVLASLASGVGEGTEQRGESYVPCELPLKLNRPALELIAPVSRAIHQGKALRVRYFSQSSGNNSEREIVPHALVDSGLRWHARVFDREKSEFRDMVLSRMESPSAARTTDVAVHESAQADEQWNRYLKLKLVPHPRQQNTRAVLRDFGIQGDEVLEISVRAALAGYVLLRWGVDCSADHTLDPTLYRLSLSNPEQLLDVQNALLAPGFERSYNSRQAVSAPSVTS